MNTMPKVAFDLRIAKVLNLVGDQGLLPDKTGFPVRNAPSPLKVFLPFVKRRTQRRDRRLALAESKAPADSGQYSLTADTQWHTTDLQLKQGERVKVTATGRLFLSKSLEVSVGPQTCVWYRIGAGPIHRLGRSEEVIVADADGVMQLQAALPGAFETPEGEISIDPPPPAMQGKLSIDLAPSEQRHATESTTPEGWQYLWKLGEAAIFNTNADNAICCHTQGDVGILQYPVELPLDDQTRISWEWLAESLPSELSEHTQPTHDYLSIAVEFDNGLDLTYMWSCDLPAGTIFQCPLPYWDKRETHWVLRTPEDGLNKWLNEGRNLLDDYQRAIGGPLPSRVVKVWLIANSAFQNGVGICRYRNIRLQHGEDSHVVHS